MIQPRIRRSLEIHNWCKWLDCNMGKLQRICSSDSLHIVCCFHMLCIISITIDYMHHLCFLYMLHYPVIYLLSERVSGSKHARNYVDLSKIEQFLATIKDLYHIQCQSILKH